MKRSSRSFDFTLQSTVIFYCVVTLIRPDGVTFALSMSVNIHIGRSVAAFCNSDNSKQRGRRWRDRILRQKVEEMYFQSFEVELLVDRRWLLGKQGWQYPPFELPSINIAADVIIMGFSSRPSSPTQTFQKALHVDSAPPPLHPEPTEIRHWGSPGGNSSSSDDATHCKPDWV